MFSKFEKDHNLELYMHVALEQDLAVKYPSLFLNPKDKSEITSIDVCNGWYDVLDALSCKLSTYPVRYASITEKHGELKIFVHKPELLEQDETNVFILLDVARNQARATCTNCGERLELHTTNCNP